MKSRNRNIMLSNLLVLFIIGLAEIEASKPRTFETGEQAIEINEFVEALNNTNWAERYEALKKYRFTFYKKEKYNNNEDLKNTLVSLLRKEIEIRNVQINKRIEEGLSERDAIEEYDHKHKGQFNNYLNRLAWFVYAYKDPGTFKLIVRSSTTSAPGIRIADMLVFSKTSVGELISMTREGFIWEKRQAFRFLSAWLTASNSRREREKGFRLEEEDQEMIKMTLLNAAENKYVKDDKIRHIINMGLFHLCRVEKNDVDKKRMKKIFTKALKSESGANRVAAVAFLGEIGNLDDIASIQELADDPYFTTYTVWKRDKGIEGKKRAVIKKDYAVQSSVKRSIARIKERYEGK